MARQRSSGPLDWRNPWRVGGGGRKSALPTVALNVTSPVLETAGSVTFTITFTAPPPVGSWIYFTTEDGTASAGADYGTVVGDLEVNGRTTIPLTVPITNRSGEQGSRTFRGRIANSSVPGSPAFLITQSSRDCTILDYDATVPPIEANLHPRLLITTATLPDLRGRLAQEPNRTRFQGYVNALNAVWDSVLGNVNDVHLGCTISGFALVGHLMDGAGVTGVTLPAAHPTPAEWRTRTATLLRAYLLLPSTYYMTWQHWIGYDWAHAEFTPAERAAFWARKTPTVSGYTLNDAEMKAFADWITSGLACHGDGVDDTNTALRISRYLTTTEATWPWAMTAMRDFVCKGGGHQQGSNYALHPEVGPYLRNSIIEETYRTAHGLDYATGWGASEQIQKWAKWWISMKVPGFPYVIGQPPMDQPNTYSREMAPITAILSRYGPDTSYAQVVQWLIDTAVGFPPQTQTGGGSFPYQSLAEIIFMRPGGPVVATTPAAAGWPVNQYFEGQGQVILRTGWLSTTDTLVRFTSPKWMVSPAVSYLNNATGHIDVYRTGPLLINQGVKARDGFQNSAWAGNAIFFPHTTIPEGSALDLDPFYAAYGGSYYPEGGVLQTGYAAISKITSNTPSSPSNMGGVKRLTFSHVTGNPVDYMFGDSTRLFANTSKTPGSGVQPVVSSVTRQMAHFRRDGTGRERIIVCDRCTTVGNHIEPRVAWHPAATMGYPPAGLTFNGSFAMNEIGRWTSTDTTAWTFRNDQVLNKDGGLYAGFNGQVRVTTLEPTAPRMVLRGGLGPNGEPPWATRTRGANTNGGKAFQNPYGVNNLQVNDGEANDGVGTDQAWRGHWRIEVIDPSETPPVVQRFLHVLEVGDAGFAPLVPVKLTGTNFVGARVGTQIAAFATTETQATVFSVNWQNNVWTGATGALTIDTPGTYTLLVADLAPSTGHTIGGQSVTSTSAGTAYVTITTTTPNQSVTIVRP